MTSPFRSLVNAKLSFEVPTGETRLNSVGNATIVTRAVIVFCYLTLDSNRPKSEVPEGFPNWAEAFTGWAVEPMILPFDVQPNTRAKATIGREAGDFMLDSVLINTSRGGIGALLERTQGTAISGWFARVA